jgi:hypothetical protein
MADDGRLQLDYVGEVNISQRQEEMRKKMLDFKEVMFYCDLHDLGYTTPRTFDNKKEEKRNVKVRLDPYCIYRLVKHLVGCRR